MVTKFDISALRIAMVKDSAPNSDVISIDSKIVVVLAHDFTDSKAVCCQMDMEGPSLFMTKISYDHITIQGYKELYQATDEKNDTTGNLRGALAYMMHVGIELDKSWGIYNWGKHCIEDQNGNTIASIAFSSDSFSSSSTTEIP